ncbi:MAG: VOC family protein [Rhizobiales bacterium]|nr:VOC family protein [Hyphomicrobiales bacterium]MBI3674465.1 VOC family protein [Hyphomicrobiales bacterium]
MTPRINFVTLGVADVGRARAFYERLGLKASSASNPQVAFFDINGVVLGLFGYASLAEDAGLEAGEPPAFRGMSLAWNAASEAEADAIMAQAETAGARIVKPAQKVFWGGYSGYFADPDGHLWEVAYNPYFPFDAMGRLVLP